MKISLLLSTLIAFSVMACEKKDAAQTHDAGNSTPATHEASSTQEIKTFNAVCPISGEKVTAGGGVIEHNGKKIGFCCPGCIDKFNANPEKALKNLSPDGQKWVSTEPGQM